MRYVRMPIEVESPEELGYSTIRYNLSESSTADRRLSDLGIAIPDDLLLLYNEHRGSEALRSLIVADAPGLDADDVLITGGAAGALVIVATALLGRDDHLVVIRPNYATNLETPRAIGCAIDIVDLDFDQGFRLDPAQLEAALRPQTRMISITTPHNPTGVTMTEAELRACADIAERHGCMLLVDETYRDLSLGERLPLAASLGKHVIGVSSLSKAYGVPGLRTGWIVCADPAVNELFLAAKEQISICGNVISEYVAEQMLARRDQLLEPTLAEMRSRFALIEGWIAGEARLQWVRPSGGVVCFPRMVEPPPGGTDAFYRRLLGEHGTYVGPGHWFEMPDTYFRLGYGWPTRDELARGLEGISRALDG
jgi:aspartate/methionine/tyrosine aminotransferase